MEKENEKAPALRRTLSVTGVVICALILPILVLNIAFLVMSFVYPDEVPGIFGITPMVVVTDSMSPTIRGGDMIVDRKVAPENVSVGDIISFFDPADPENKIVMTHRVVSVRMAPDGYRWTTKGDANNVEDPYEVPESKLVGVYRLKIPIIGEVVLFMRTPLGIFVSVILPILSLVTYDLIRRRIDEKNREHETEALRAELAVYRQQAEH